MSNDFFGWDATEQPNPTAGGTPKAPSHGERVGSVPDLRGKTLVVWTRSRGSPYPAIIRDCSFAMQAGRLFLTGTKIPSQKTFRDWADGMRLFIGWDAIEEYLAFDTPEAYYSRLQSLAHYFGTQGPVEPSGIPVDRDTVLEAGDTVLAEWAGAWWRAEVIEVHKNGTVTVHYPGWDAQWDEAVPRRRLQVDIAGPVEGDDE
jgi:hypothetical protein